MTLPNTIEGEVKMDINGPAGMRALEEAKEQHAMARMIGTGSVGQRATRPEDINGLRQTLETHVARAHDAADRVRYIGNQLFGDQAAATIGGNASSNPKNPPPEPTLQDLVDQLGVALGRIELGLSRL